MKEVDMFGYRCISMYPQVCFGFARWCYFEFIFDSNSLQILFYYISELQFYKCCAWGKKIWKHHSVQFLSIFPLGNNEKIAWTRPIFHDNSGWAFSNLTFVGGDILVDLLFWQMIQNSQENVKISFTDLVNGSVASKL